MADCKITRLSKKEAKFIRWATVYYYGVLDFENMSSSEFRKTYGLPKDDFSKFTEVLQAKMDQLLNQFEKETKTTK